MILFSKDKEIIFKITNAILLIWFLGALVFACYSIIELTFQEPKYTYDEYSNANCGQLRNDLEPSKDKEDCQKLYNNYLYYLKRDNYYKQKNIYIAIANVIIVGGTMFVINKDKKNKKANK